MWRFRLTTELSHELLFSSGTSLTPWAELSVRHDGGDGQTGAGLEMGGGLRYRVPQVGLTAEGYGRWLAVHEGTLQEWGVGAMVTIDPGMDRRGLSASVTPSWGRDRRAAFSGSGSKAPLDRPGTALRARRWTLSSATASLCSGVEAC